MDLLSTLAFPFIQQQIQYFNWLLTSETGEESLITVIDININLIRKVLHKL